MNVIELNQCYRVKPYFPKTKDGKSISMVGRVVYIHPEERYAVLEFQGQKGNPREAFYPEQLTEKNRVLQKMRH